MRYIKTPKIPKHAGRTFVITHVIVIIACLVCSILLPDAISTHSAQWFLFVICVLAAFAFTIHLIVRLTFNKGVFDPKDPAYETEWIEISPDGISFKEKEFGKDFVYSGGKLCWEDLTWIRTNTYRLSGKPKTSEIFLYIRKELASGSFLHHHTADPTVQRIGMLGYNEDVVEEIKKYGSGKVRFELK